MSKKAWILVGALIVTSLVLVLVFRYKRTNGTNHNGNLNGPGSTWSLTEAAKPYRGQTIRLIGEDYPPLQAIEKMKPDFEKVTGINVEVERYEAEAVLQKIAFDLNSKTGRYDLIIGDIVVKSRNEPHGFTDVTQHFEFISISDREGILRPDSWDLNYL